MGTDSDSAMMNPPEASMNEDEDIANEAPSDSDVAGRAIKQEPPSYDEDTVCSETGPQEFKSVAIPVEVKAEVDDEDTDVEDSASSKEEGGKKEKALKDTGDSTMMWVP
eukprot:scaffold34646_cov239-Skeletonema_dohrnii-CCMP3373.AAC.1